MGMQMLLQMKGDTKDVMELKYLRWMFLEVSERMTGSVGAEVVRLKEPTI